MEVDKDHILIHYQPTKSILELVILLKQISKYRIWRLNENHILIRKHFFGQMVILLAV